MTTFVNNKTLQPPLSHFDQSFSDNTWDALFCALNDIDPKLAEADYIKEPPFLPQKVIDPRNKLPITQSFYDHTVHQRPQIFKCPNRSILTPNEHNLCLSFLQSLKAKTQIFPHQIVCFEETFARRQKEQVAFLEFLSQYNTASYEKIYAPNLMFLGFYQELYKKECKLLMDRHSDGIFQIHTGFPTPQKCGNPEKLGSIIDLEILDADPAPPRLDPNEDLSRIRPRIENYFEAHLNQLSLPQQKSFNHEPRFHISLEAIVFLLSAGEYIDIPSEVLVQVVISEGGENIILIDDPLPARNTGCHTAERVAGICTEVFHKLKVNKHAAVIQATNFQGPYHLQTIESYINSEPKKQSTSCSTESRNCAFVKWTLNVENDNQQISIISRTKNGHKDSPKMLKQTFHSLKLEYKPQFGCEITSKHNLLREWLLLQFSNSPDSLIHRHRINASTFETVLKENLQLEEIEIELERRYKVKTARLLGSLADFLGLLSNIGPGRYMLRHNARFCDKLMLYAESKESTSKSSISLHNLLQEVPSDLAFMTLRQLTPIDDTLCTAMHDFYKILPSCFPAGLSKAKKTRRVIDDRSFLQKKAKIKMDILEQKKLRQKTKRNVVKRAKRAQKAKQKKNEVQEKKNEENELQDEIKNDRILFGFE